MSQFQEETVLREGELFNQEQLEAIRRGLDCHIDDPELLTAKKGILGNFSPLQAINAIKGKFPEIAIEIT